ncbi:hypothetical protein PQBR44_0160 (plasmid) [Pseudomonas putida UWC1]|nr:hypothetical protein PQBR44_0160 [Pseudomonas putida UWC1]
MIRQRGLDMKPQSPRIGGKETECNLVSREDLARQSCTIPDF